MPIQYKIRRGYTSEANSLTLTEGEIYMDLDQNDLRVHNGTTQGGHRIPNADFVNELISGLATVATSGSYSDLSNKPFIPNLTSQLMNDAGFIGSNTLARLHSISEKLNTKTNASGTVVHDMNDSAIWYHSNIITNFTVNLTNVPIASNQSIGIALVLAQGNLPLIPSAFQIDGVTQTINWQDSAAPTGNANKTDVVNFTLIRLSSSWIVLGSLSTYG